MITTPLSVNGRNLLVLALTFCAGTFSSPSVLAADSYIGFGLGAIYAPTTRLSEPPVEVDYDLGFQVGAFVYGYKFQNNWRTELEASFRRNELEVLEFDDGSLLNTGRHDSLQSISLMSNTAYEFDWNIPIKPYLGAGLGVSRVSFRVSSHLTGENYLKDDAVTGAYQVFAGARVPIGKRFSVAAEYRYWSTFDFKMTSEGDERVKGKYTGHMAMLNFTYQLSDRASGQTATTSTPEPDRSGWYLGFQLGAAAAGDARIDDDLIDTNFDAFDLGGATSLAAGYSHVLPSGHRLRAELELGYWQNGADLIEFGEFLGELRLDGDVKVQNLAANFFYDFGRDGALKPYVGFGVGYANLDYDIDLRNEGETSDFLKDNYSGLSAQVLAGIAARLTSHVEASLNYRYWWAPTVKLETPTGSKVETEHVMHMLTLGIRYRLGR